MYRINGTKQNTRGWRNNALFHYGVYAKSKWPEGWKSKIVVFNETAMQHH